MNRRDELALRTREVRYRIEMASLNRALRHRKTPIDRVITRVAMTRLPDVPDDQAGGGSAQRGMLDAPPKPRA
jgi:hypothetical protein